MKEPLVSIIVPIYNVEKYLKKCLDSILEQTYKNIEIILVNDGSMDSSGDICMKYKKNDKRIKLFTQHNNGVACARNIGLEKSSGDLVCFIDPDDYVEREYIALLVKILMDGNGDIAICGYYLVDEDGNKYGRHNDNGHEKISVYDQDEATEELLYQKSIDNSLCWRIFRREVLKGVSFPEGMIFEDYAVMYNILKNASIVLKSNVKLYNYVQRSDSIMHSPFSEKNFDILKVSKVLYNRVTTEKPNLKKAVTSRIVSACFYLLRVIDKKRYQTEYRSIIEVIKKYRWAVLIDRKSKVKIKFGILLSYVSPSLISLIYNFSFVKRKIYMK